MPTIPIRNEEEYCKIIEVLDRVGGTWHGVGDKERFFLVTSKQYQALVDAKVVNGKRRVRQAARRGGFPKAICGTPRPSGPHPEQYHPS